MRILTITTSYPRHPGDFAGRFVRDLNAGLVALGHEVMTLCPWQRGLPAAEDDREAGPVRRARGRDDRSEDLFYGAGVEANARRLGARRSLAAFRDATFAFGGALSELLPQADVVLAHWVFPSAWWAARAGGKAKVVGVVHGADARLLARPLLGRLVASRLRGRLDAVACVSAGAWARISPRLDVASDRVTFVPMGIDTSVFTAAPEAGRDPALVVGAGRLVRAKGFDLLVRACEGLGVRVVIAGEGPDRDAIAREARSMGVALGLPGVLGADALAALFRKAGLVVIPSRGGPGDCAEGAPLVAMEALACGAAVVGSGAGGLPDLLGANATAARGLSGLRHLITAALRAPERFRDSGAARRFDRVAIAGRLLAAL